MSIKIWKATRRVRRAARRADQHLDLFGRQRARRRRPPLHYPCRDPRPGLPCTRNNAANPDSIGVSLTYNYSMVTPLSSVARFFGGGASSGLIPMDDRTIMALNP